MRTLLALLVLTMPLAAAEPTSGVLTPEALGEMLTNLAYEPKDVSNNKTKDVYEIMTERDGWKIYPHISLSNDRTRIWFYIKTKPLPNPDEASGEAWLKLLETNVQISPAFFSYEEKTKRIYLWMAVENVDMTPVVMRRLIEQFDGIVRKTGDYWASRNFKATPKAPPLDAAGRAFLKRLEGAWEVIAEERNGQVARAEDVQTSAIVYTFVPDGKLSVMSAHKPEIVGSVWVDGKTPGQLDFIFPAAKTVQRALVKLEGDTLTICVANSDAVRPAQFSGKSDGASLYTLKRRK